jgi:citrate lyase subunit beta/citryl-CoA lyase
METSMPLPRSFLYVPANREKFLDKSIGLPADALLLDLEDSVPAPEKATARAAVRAYAPKILGGRLWVRANAINSDDGRADLDAIVAVPGLAGIVAPKVDSREEVLLWDRLIGGLEEQRGVAPGTTKFIASIESARGVWFAYDIASAAKRVVSLSFGGARDGDLNTDLGCTWSLDGPEMLHARQHVLVAARAAGFEQPLDGVFADIRDAEGFARDTDLSRRLGYRGRKLIHPSQIEPCNRLYRLSTAELDYYARVLEAFDAAVAQGHASTTVDGKMIDVAMAAAARRVLEQEKVWARTG